MPTGRQPLHQALSVRRPDNSYARRRSPRAPLQVAVRTSILSPRKLPITSSSDRRLDRSTTSYRTECIDLDIKLRSESNEGLVVENYQQQGLAAPCRRLFTVQSHSSCSFGSRADTLVASYAEQASLGLPIGEKLALRFMGRDLASVAMPACLMLVDGSE